VHHRDLAAQLPPDRDVLDLYRDLLSTFGYEVETYTDALPGIEQLVASRPDLLIVDVELDPEREQLTGLQVVHSARSGTPLQDVPIVICTTASSDEEAKALLAGFNMPFSN
jgi:CheY-like chemotaxis protein